MVIKVNQQLSKNIICSWKITKITEPNNNYNIVSVAFFKKYELYKDFDIYINGLKSIINLLPQTLSNFKLRIYHDFSVSEIVKSLYKNREKLIELYEYDIPYFKEEKNKMFHVGTIGTLIRYLPLTDLEYHKVNKCIIFDIDNYFDKFYKNLIIFYQNNNIKFSYRSRFCYLNKWILCSSDNEPIKYTIISSYIYQSISTPYKILGKFFDDIYNDNLKDLIKNCELKSKYEYGIDEIFMNEFYIKYFYQNKIQIAPVLNYHNSIPYGIRKYINFVSGEQYNLYIKFLEKLFLIMNINLEKYLLFIVDDKYSLDPANSLLKKEYERNTSNILRNVNIIKNLKDYINSCLEDNTYKKLYKFDLLLFCILNYLKYIEFKKINILIIDTDYTDHAIVKNIQKKTLKMN